MKPQEPVMDPGYWKYRLQHCGGELHRTIFNGSIDQFSPLQQEHKRYLRKAIGPNDSVFDAGCGYGRILDLLPAHWVGDYIGVDVSPDLIATARLLHPETKTPRREFFVMDLSVPLLRRKMDEPYDHVIACSLRPMILRNCGEEVWARIEANLLKIGKQIHYLTFGEWD